VPNGDDAYARKQKQMESRRALYDDRDAPRINYFKLQGGTYGVIRPLEQGADLTFADTHRIPIQGKTKRFFKTFLCRNLNGDGSPCPFCQSAVPDISRSSTVGYVNVIWREAPIFQKDGDGKMVKNQDGSYTVIGREDQIALWNPSWTVFEMLKEKDRRYSGVMSRDWEVKREGSGPDNTKYFIDSAIPDGGSSPLTIADLVLAEKKYDLAAMLVPKPYEVLAEVLGRGAMPPGQGAQPTADRSGLTGGGQSSDQAFQPSGTGEVTRSSAFSRG
jgi:hypothetical protein